MKDSSYPDKDSSSPDLMDQFHVGRGTIREVLNRLSSAGIVTLIRHRGAAVRILSRSEVCQLLDVVEILFGLAARRTTEQPSPRPSPATPKRSTTPCDAMQQFESKDDFVGFESARENFYRAVMHLSGNYELTRLFPTMQVHIMRTQLRQLRLRGRRCCSSATIRAITRARSCPATSSAPIETAPRAHVRHTTDHASANASPDRALRQREPERDAT